MSKVLTARGVVQDHKLDGYMASDFPVSVAEAMGLPLSDHGVQLIRVIRENEILDFNEPLQ